MNDPKPVSIRSLAGRQPQSAGAGPPRLRWPEVARALRTARGLTQEGWAAQLGLSDVTVRRWERGAAAPTAHAEAALVTWCRAANLFRAFDNGPLRGVTLTPELLADVLAAARLSPHPRRAEDAPAQPLALVPPRAPAPPEPSVVPLPPARLIGREAEVDCLRTLLLSGGVRLMTLTGMGGAGKTRLALEVVAELAAEFPGGVCAVRLETVRDPELVLPAIAAGLGVVDSGTRPLVEQVRERLSGDGTLLLLDNFEQVLPAARAVAGLIATCPRLRVLVTSRIPLRVAGEQELAIAPLAPAAALALFAERAAAVRPGIALGGAQAEVAAAICARLDGLPLAIELAAVWLKALSLSDLHRRLMAVLARRGPHPGDRPKRHQTLLDTIAWSYHLLDGQEQALFRRLAVFAGGWTLEAAEVICSDTVFTREDVLPLLAQLVDQSLVVVDAQEPETRYRFLETVGSFAADRLKEAGEQESLRQRYRDWCITMAERESANQAAGMEVLAREHDNLRAALAWQSGSAAEPEERLRLVAALWRYWQVRGHLVEGRRWLEEALAAGGQAPLSLRARALNGLGSIAFYQSDMQAAVQHYGDALAARRALGDQRGVVTALSNLAIAAFTLGRAAEAGVWWEEALTLARAQGDKRSAAQALGGLSLKAQDDGDYDRARVLLKEAHVIWEELGDTIWIARSHGNISAVAYYQGDDAASQRHGEVSLAMARRLGNQRNISMSLQYLGKLALRQGDVAAARRMIQESLAGFWSLGDSTNLALVLESLAGLAHLTARPEQAARIYGAASAFRVQRGDRRHSFVEPEYRAAVTAARMAPAKDATWEAAWAEGATWTADQAYTAGLEL